MKQATSTIYLLFLAMLFSSQIFAFKSSPSIFRHATAGMQRRGHTAMALASTDATPYINFLKGPAALGSVALPPRLGTLLDLLQTVKGEELVAPSDRAALHPLFVPLTRKGPTYTGVLRWPTPPEDLPLPIVQTDGLGMRLLSNDPEHLIRRLVVEADAEGHPDLDAVVAAGNAGLAADAHYKQGDVQALGLGVEKYLLMRVGPFADAYETLAEGHLARGDEQSALVAAERANAVFKGWGRPYAFYAQLLASLQNRELEQKDAAKVAMRLPLWTAAYDRPSLDRLVKLSGYTEVASARQLYEKMAADQQRDKITEGKAPAQVALDRSAYVMDAVMFQEEGGGGGGWAAARADLAQLYEEGGVPELATFVRDY